MFGPLIKLLLCDDTRPVSCLFERFEFHFLRLHINKTKKAALAIRRIISIVDMITKAKFSNSPNDFKIRLIG